MTFNSPGGASNGTDYIYPYLFNINRSSALTALMCVSYDNEIVQGEWWTATTSPITTASSPVDQEDAYLFSLLGGSTYSTLDIQEAAWDLSVAPDVTDATSVTSDTTLPFEGSADTLAGDAVSAITTSGTDLSSFDNGQYTLYTPATTGQSTGGIPQTFVGVSPVPEPSSLLLLASGLFGCAGLLYRRRRAIL
jgi:hypothetical protein